MKEIINLVRAGKKAKAVELIKKLDRLRRISLSKRIMRDDVSMDDKTFIMDTIQDTIKAKHNYVEKSKPKQRRQPLSPMQKASRKKGYKDKKIRFVNLNVSGNGNVSAWTGLSNTKMD